jgi:thiol-disulfide isomerase/thioredoxin
MAQGTGAATTTRGSLLETIAHRLAGDPAELPIEGQLASFDGATGWLNSAPLTPESLRGRVVLVDFWTYTCVNWLRTLPYLRAWADKYRKGLTVVGVHTPEFGFERDVENVTARARDLGVDYPVALDSEYAIWRAFDNHFWPALYIADGEGRIRYHHFGEGEYAMAEMAIQQLLIDQGAEAIDQGIVAVQPHGLEVAADWATLRSPETYVGYGQASGFASEDEASYDEARAYSVPPLRLNEWALGGIWTVAQHAAVSNEPNGRIAFRFQARDVNLVIGPASPGSSVPFRVLLDGEPPTDAHGTDIDLDGGGLLREQRTYQLIRQPGPIRERTVEIEFLESGAEAYCFTFG